MHLAFDSWMQTEHPNVPFERYADDVVAHCQSKSHAQTVLDGIERRLRRCRLELHPDKTKLVLCKDDNRRGRHEHEKFDFLGFTFRPRRARSPGGKPFISFLPAVSTKAQKAMRRTMRGWKIARRSDRSLDDLARMVESTVRGWINYYGRFYKAELAKVFRPLDRALGRWAMRKFGSLRRGQRRAEHWLGRVARRQPGLFAHWRLLGRRPTAG
jgi:RNA-directed DNA polymerase